MMVVIRWDDLEGPGRQVVINFGYGSSSDHGYLQQQQYCLWKHSWLTQGTVQLYTIHNTNNTNSQSMGKQLVIRSYWVIYLMGFLTALSSFVSGYSHVFLAQLEQLIVLKQGLTPSESSMVLTVVVSASFMGEIIGPFLYKELLQKYGERRAMIKCYLVIMATIAVQLIDLRLSYLLGSRLVMGLIIGIQASILPLYLNSLSPVSVSGKLGSMNQLLTCYGVITAYSLGFLVGQDRDDQVMWRVLVGLPIIPSLLSIISLQWLFPYDSLERHIAKDETKAILQYCERVYSNAEVEDIRLLKMVHHSRTTGEYKRELQRYVLALVVDGSCQLTGINAIFLYSKQLFEEITDDDQLLSQQLMLGMAFCQLGACTLSGRLIDSFGRKCLVLWGQMGLMGVLSAIFLVDCCSDLMRPQAYHYTLITLFYLHVIVFNFTLGPVGILYAAELVDNLTPVIFTKRMVNLLIAISTNYLMHEFGIGPMFLMYAMLSLLAHYYIRDRMRETKGKTRLQVLEMFETFVKESEPEEKRLVV